MSIITIDKRTVPVTARNGRIYTTTGTVSTSSSSSSSGIGNIGTVTGVTAGNGMTQTGTATLNPILNIVSSVGIAGTVGTVVITADAVGVTLGTTSTSAAAGNHTHATLYAPISASANYIQNQYAAAQTANLWISGSAKIGTGVETIGNIFANKLGAVFSMGNGAGSFGTIGFNNTTNDVELKQKYVSGGIRLYTNTTVERLAVLANGNTEFRNATGVLIAVLDINGNLRVKGEITAFATI